jgi:cytochrome c
LRPSRIVAVLGTAFFASMEPAMSMKVLMPVIIAAALAVPATARANADLAKAKHCTACHAVDKKLIGPSYKDVAAKYASDKDAATKLARKVREGGVGAWGQIPMPANPQVTNDEALTLVRWILATK